MWEIYNLPRYWDLVILNNYFYLELYTLIFAWVLLFLWFKRVKLLEILFIAGSVMLYKFVTQNLFWSSCCSIQTNYFPSLSEINILIWVVTFGNILWWLLLATKFTKNHALLWFIAFSYLFSIVNEVIIQWLGLRVYGENITALLSGTNLFGISIETYAYILVWVILITSTYGYLSQSISWKASDTSTKNIKWYLLFSIIGALLGEIILHPQFIYSWLPGFTNLYQDINVLILLLLGISLFLSVYIPDIILKTFYKRKWYTELSISIGINTILYSMTYILLGKLGMFEFDYKGFSLWVNFIWLPTELFVSVALISALLVMFVRNYTK
jgi:hypothetical protein